MLSQGQYWREIITLVMAAPRTLAITGGKLLNRRGVSKWREGGGGTPKDTTAKDQIEEGEVTP